MEVIGILMINGFEDFNEVEVVVEKSKGKEVSLTSPENLLIAAEPKVDVEHIG